MNRFAVMWTAWTDWNPLGLSVLITLVIAPPLVAFKIFEPCWSCYDFEAAAIHEVRMHAVGATWLTLRFRTMASN